MEEVVKKKMGRPKTKTMYVSNKTRKKPVPRMRSERDYDFLQYIRIVFRWATTTTDLTRPEVEMLLYLYPKGAFTRSDFVTYQKVISMYQIKSLNKLIEEGWIYLWRPYKKNQRALFALTNKAKQICSKMHQFCTGDKSIPVKTRTNKLLKSELRIDGYYMDIIMKMNKERERNLKEQRDAE